MKRYLYNYETVITFGAPVINHSVLLRCQPMDEGWQNIEEEHLIFSPDFWTSRSRDAFGNRIVYGGQREPHSSLVYVSAGIVKVEPYSIVATHGVSPIYHLPTPLTTLPPTETPERTGDTLADAMAICQRVNSLMEYAPGQTDVRTTAADALRLGKGVCQDFAHVAIALCRQAGIAARYACGFVEGTGQTHAWVEIYDGYRWAAFDPTANAPVEYGYVKIAHGRDAADCAVSRGLYGGATTQEMEIRVTLKEF